MVALYDAESFPREPRRLPREQAPANRDLEFQPPVTPPPATPTPTDAPRTPARLPAAPVPEGRGFRRQPRDVVPEQASTVVPGSFASPGVEGSLASFRTPAFAENRVVGGSGYVPDVSGFGGFGIENEGMSEDEALRRYFTQFGR